MVVGEAYVLNERVQLPHVAVRALVDQHVRVAGPLLGIGAHLCQRVVSGMRGCWRSCACSMLVSL